MKTSARFLSLSPAVTVLLMLLTASSPALAKSSKDDELSEIVPTFGTPSPYNKLPDEVVSAFMSSDNVTLYSIEESETGREKIHGYKVLGKARIKKDETAAIFADLQKSLTKENWGAMCFHPHHALRAEVSGHTYDMVICYLCGLVDSYEMDSSPEGNDLSGNSLQGSPDVINGIAGKYRLPKPNVLIRDEAITKNIQREYVRDLRDMPQSIRPLYPQTINPRANNPAPEDRTLREALAKQYPDTKQRILALFAWYGSASPSGDADPKRLLQGYEFTDLWPLARSDRLSNAQLEGAARFFASKYIDQRLEHNRAAQQDGMRRYSEEMAHWIQVMPASVRPLWKDEMWQYHDYGNVDEQVHADEELMLQALSKEIPDKNRRIITLLNWYGSDAGDGSTFGSYKLVVVDLLRKFTTSEVARALESTTLTEPQLDSAVHLFGQSAFGQDRRAEIRTLPPALKALLWAHAKKNGNERIYKVLFAQLRPTPGDGIIHPFVRQIVPNDDYVAFFTVYETQAEPQFAALMVPGTPIDERIHWRPPAGDVGGPCINTGKARYLINEYDVLLFEILADCGNLARGYGYVICHLNGERRCAEAPDWYFTGRVYQLTNEGLQVDRVALHAWQDPIETQRRLQAMAARITAYYDRASKRHAPRGRSISCHILDPPSGNTAFMDAPNLDGIRDGDEIDMNSSVGNWIKQKSKDPDASEWACWAETP